MPSSRQRLPAALSVSVRGMQARASSLLLIAFALGSACGTEPSVATVEFTVLDVAPGICIADADDARTTPFVIDLLEERFSELPLVLHTVATVTNNDETWSFLAGEASIFFTIDEGALRAAPRSTSTARVTPLSQSIFNLHDTFSTDHVVAAITTDDVVALRTEPAVLDALVIAADRLGMTMTLNINGRVLANDDNDDGDTFIEFEEATLEVLLELCRGCLIEQVCEAPAVQTQACFAGVDGPRCTTP